MQWNEKSLNALGQVRIGNRKARKFIGRFMNLEVARGWAALHAQYLRVVQLRVMLKRVQNPRAVGMLRQWLKLAARRTEQLRKLRSALSHVDRDQRLHSSPLELRRGRDARRRRPVAPL